MHHIKAANLTQMMRTNIFNTSGGSRNFGGGGKQHEIQVTAFGGHLFYHYFLQTRGGGVAPLEKNIQY